MESHLQEELCNYIRFYFPSVIFRSDLGGIKLTLGQAAKVKRLQSSRAYPDLFIAEARHGWHGLFIELKREGRRVYLRDGVTLIADWHVREQAEMLEQLQQRGYKAVFAVGFDEAKQVVDEYLGKRDNKAVNEANMNGRVDHYAA